MLLARLASAMQTAVAATVRSQAARHVPGAARPPASTRSLFAASRVLAAAPASRQAQGAGAAPVRAPVGAHAYAYDAAAVAPAEIDEVDFEPVLANSVRLIGNIGSKYEPRVFERSKLQTFSLAVKLDTRREETEWVTVEAWGPLGERVTEQLNKGDNVAVQGRLRLDRWDDKNTGERRAALKVVASAISRVRPSYGQAQQAAAAQQQPAAQAAPWGEPAVANAAVASPRQAGAPAAAGGPTLEELWMEFFMRPDLWYDNRTNKRNPKAPDFKKKEGGMNAPALWVEGRGTPNWVKGELQRLDDLRAAAEAAA